MTLLLDTSLWIDFTRARSPAPLKKFIAPFVLDPEAHLAEPTNRQPSSPPCPRSPPLQICGSGRSTWAKPAARSVRRFSASTSLWPLWLCTTTHC